MRTNSKCTCVSMVTKHAFLADFSTIKNVLRTHTGGLHTGSSVDRSHLQHLDAAPAHALPRASSALARRGRRPAHPTASWLLQPPATRQPLAPWPLREANSGHLVRVDQLEVQLGLLRRKRLNGVEAGLPLAEESSACPEPRLSSKVHERSGHKLVSGQERPDQTG
jgi:hypothetical protein